MKKTDKKIYIDRNRNKNRNKWLILIITVLCPFMATIDSSIVNVALPVMSVNLHVHSSQIAWVIAIYLLGQVSTMLFFGKLGDMKGLSRVFQFGVILFTVGSFFCSLSESFSMLLVSRIVQSLGASATLSNTHAILTRTFEEKERGKALGINGAFVAFGYLLGPSLGGFILLIADWHFMFWINIPFGIVVFILGLRFLPIYRGKRGKIDWKGVFFFAISMLSFFIALQNMEWDHFLVLLLFALSCISLVFFIFRQMHTDSPFIDLTIFKNRWFRIGLFCAFASYMAISAYNLLMPFYMEDVRHFSPFVSGLFMSIYPLVITLVAPVSGILSDKIGTEKLTFIGLFLYTVGLVLLSLLNGSTIIFFVVCFLLLMSIGNGFFQSPNNVIVMSSVSSSSLGIAGSLNALSRTIGQTTGIAVTNFILYAGMSMKLGRPVSDFTGRESEAFLFGMRYAYVSAFVVCLFGLIATAARLHFRKE